MEDGSQPAGRFAWGDGADEGVAYCDPQRERERETESERERERERARERERERDRDLVM